MSEFANLADLVPQANGCLYITSTTEINNYNL